MSSAQRNDLKVFSAEEIEIFVAGEPRDVNRLILQGISSLTSAVIPHMERLDTLADVVGSPERVKIRADWVEAQITRQEVRNSMMRKVTESAVQWAIIVFLGFLLWSIKDWALYSIRELFVSTVSTLKVPPK